MKRIVVEVNQIATFAMTGKIVEVARAVVRSDKIVGLVELSKQAMKLCHLLLSSITTLMK